LLSWEIGEGGIFSFSPPFLGLTWPFLLNENDSLGTRKMMKETAPLELLTMDEGADGWLSLPQAADYFQGDNPGGIISEKVALIPGAGPSGL